MKTVVKGIACSLLLAAALSALLISHPTSAESTGPSVSGKFELRNQDGPAKSITFNAIATKEGRVFGQAVLQDDAAPSPQPSASSSETGAPATPFFLKAEFDCLVVKKNKAVMSGNVTESSVERYIGRLFLLVAEDNGHGAIDLLRDKLTWGLYRTTTKNWLPSDSERTDEESSSGPVAGFATDLERPELEGVVANKNEVVGCQTFPLSSFSFADGSHGRGSVQVRP